MHDDVKYLVIDGVAKCVHGSWITRLVIAKDTGDYTTEEFMRCVSCAASSESIQAVFTAIVKHAFPGAKVEWVDSKRHGELTGETL